MRSNRDFLQACNIIGLTFLLWCGNSVITPFLPILAKKVNLTLVETSIFLGAMGIARFCSQPFLGVTLTRINKSFILKVIFVMLLIANIGYLLTNKFTILIICRVLEALAFASFAISIRTIINENFHLDYISKINHYYAGAQNLGRFIGPALAGIFIDRFGIKSIFYITIVLYLLGMVSTNLSNSKDNFLILKKKDNNPLQINLFTPKILVFLILYLIEFIGLGFWLAGWSTYAINNLGWKSSVIGLSFSVIAITSILIVPLIDKILFLGLQTRIILGTLFLFLIPVCPIVFHSTPILIWFGLGLGGFGSTIYFSAFHTYIAKYLNGNKIAIFYGVVGSFSFLGQAIGQTATPVLSHLYSSRAPIIADSLLLALDLLFYVIFFYMAGEFSD